jgi:hypothetical protein
MAQLGRIGGHLLNANLIRNGVDLSFKNTTFDSTPILFLDVNSGKVGIKTDSPAFDLDVNSDIKTTNAQATSQAKIDNIVAQANGTFTTLVGPINIMPQTAGSFINLQRMRSDDLDFNDNTISGLNSNQNIELITSGSGKVDVAGNAEINGNLYVTGNVTIDGDLSGFNRIFLGDELYNPDTNSGDVIEIAPDFTQSIIPGDDNTYDLGTGTIVDSSKRRWGTAYVTDNLVNTDLPLPNEVRVSDQLQLNGVTNEIFALQSNDDVILAPDTGINYIESTRWREITASSSSASITGNTLTVGGTITGSFVPGMQLTGVGISVGTVITGTSTGSDSSGTYTVNLTYDGSGGNPAPTGTISITGAVDVIENLTDIGGGKRFDPETPLTFTSTGIGYLRFMGDNGFVLPAGTDAERPTRPELGDTRWNTDQDYLEAFAGRINVVTALGNVSGLVDQVRTGLTGTVSEGEGKNAVFAITITSGTIAAITITNQGQEYIAGDTILILGTAFSGGSTPANDITVTVGAQINGGYELATGGGAEVDIELMEDLGDAYSLILG